MKRFSFSFPYFSLTFLSSKVILHFPWLSMTNQIEWPFPILPDLKEPWENTQYWATLLHFIMPAAPGYISHTITMFGEQTLQTQDKDDSRHVSEGSRVMTLFKPASTAWAASGSQRQFISVSVVIFASPATNIMKLGFKYPQTYNGCSFSCNCIKTINLMQNFGKATNETSLLYNNSLRTNFGWIPNQCC